MPQISVGRRRQPYALIDVANPRWYASQIAFYVLPWIYANRWSVAWPTMRSFVDAVRCSELGKSLPLGVAGFCWGGKHAIVLTHADSVTASGRPLVDASFIAHPSVVSYPDEVEKVRRPISLAIGDRDMSVSMSQVEITRKAWDALKGTVETEIVVYPGANHGFTVRVDHFNGKLLEQCQAAEDQAVNWFKRHFAQENPILS